MPLIKANGIDIFYDEFGQKADPAILLVMGLGTQMIAWSEDFCGKLAAEGFRVIRYDNRDTGLSQKFENGPKYSLPWAFLKARLGWKVRSPYSLSDMAADAVGLLDALGLQRAHIVGASMGGMIGQIVAAEYPERCLSFTSMMSTSGRRGLPGPKPRAMAGLRERRPPMNDREANIDFGVRIVSALAGSGYPPPLDELRRYIARAYDRSVYPAGFIRQFLAILADGSRVELLKTIHTPTLVLHGEDDPLIPVEGGRDTARLIKDAKLETILGWGHDFPATLTQRLIASISDHAKSAAGDD
jgi:pimeloyl-ACP methyl ester carboxylesterase